MVLFGSQEWLDEYRRRINESAAYRAAAASWEGTVAYLFESESDGDAESRCVLLDLWRGRCRDARETVREEADQALCLISAPYSRWKQVVRGELAPIAGMMQGKLCLRGDVPSLIRYIRASGELVHIAAQIPTEFADD